MSQFQIANSTSEVNQVPKRDHWETVWLELLAQTYRLFDPAAQWGRKHSLCSWIKQTYRLFDPAAQWGRKHSLRSSVTHFWTWHPSVQYVITLNSSDITPAFRAVAIFRWHVGELYVIQDLCGSISHSARLSPINHYLSPPYRKVNLVVVVWRVQWVFWVFVRVGVILPVLRLNIAWTSSQGCAVGTQTSDSDSIKAQYALHDDGKATEVKKGATRRFVATAWITRLLFILIA
jgi:hypothetical protein